MLVSAKGRAFHSKPFHVKKFFNHMHSLYSRIKVFPLLTWQSRRVNTVSNLEVEEESQHFTLILYFRKTVLS